MDLETNKSHLCCLLQYKPLLEGKLGPLQCKYKTLTRVHQAMNN